MEGIGSDDSFELLVCFYFCSPILKVFLNIQKNQDYFQARPNPKSPNDPWWLCTLSWFDGKWIAKLIYDVSVLELRWNTFLCDNYTLLRFSSIWVNQVFSFMFFRKKCELILISFGFLNFIFVLSFLIVECLKSVVLIILEVDSLQIMFIVFGVEILKHFYIILILLLFVVFFLYFAWGQTRF